MSPLARGRALLFALALSAGCVAPRQGAGGACLFNDDCASPLVCAGHRCRAPCQTDRDCSNGYRCRASGTAGQRVCLPPEEEGYCTYSAECEEQKLCVSGRCALQCSADAPCAQRFGAGFTCNRSTSRCVAPSADAGLPEAGPDAPLADAPSADAPLDAPALDASAEASAEGGTDAGAEPLDAPLESGTDAGFDGDPDAWGRYCPNGASVLPGQRFVSLGATTLSTCGVATDGQVRCWGQNDNGRLGAGLPASSIPCPAGGTVLLDEAPTAPLRGVVRLAYSAELLVALMTDGTLRTWGYTSLRGVHAPTGGAFAQERAIQVAPTDPAVDVAYSGVLTCVLTVTGGVRCTGGGIPGDGRPIGDGLSWSTPLGLPPARGLAVGQSHVCVLGVDQGVYCFGSTSSGQFGDGLLGGNVVLPARVDFGAVAGVTGAFEASLDRLYAGGTVTCASLRDGRLFCWGSLGAGFGVGTGAASVQASPAPVQRADGSTLTDARDLCVGPNHACAALFDGSVWCWGRNNQGQLGDGTQSTRLVATRALTPPGMQAVACGNEHSCAARNDGTVWCWGSNQNAQLGPAGMPYFDALPHPTPRQASF